MPAVHAATLNGNRRTFPMNFAFLLLMAGIGLSPLFLFSDAVFVQGIFTAYVAVTLLITVISIRPGEAAFLSGLLRPAMLLAIVPLIWLAMQIMPLPFGGVEHPIWESARTALGKSIWGSITISPGATLLVIARSLSALGLCLVASAVCMDRRRAEIVLLGAAAVTSLLACVAIVHNVGGFEFLGDVTSVGPRASIAAAAVLGTILTAASMLYAFERYETRHGRGDFSYRYFAIVALASLLGFLLCWVAILLFMSTAILFATLCGVGAFLLIVCFRRLGFRVRTGLFLAAAAIAVPLSVIVPEIWAKKFDLSILFAADAASPLLALTQRIVNDTGWFGSGAGTFAALLSIYQDLDGVALAPEAPTFAASILIGMGRIWFWLALAGGLAAFIWFLAGALQRGRDSFFVAATTSCTLALLIEALVDASLSGTTTVIAVAAVLGLGIAQRTSRTVR